MNLLDMADFVCGKVNQNEDEDLAACKGFLQDRLKLIWNDSLWKDSIVEYLQTLSMTGYTVTSNWLPTAGVLLLPKDIERVLAVRTDARALRIQRPEYYYRRDYDTFGNNGQAVEFILLPPCVWQFETAQDPLHLWFDNDGDIVGTNFIYETLNANGVDLTRTTTISNDIVDLPATTLVASLQKSVTSGKIFLVAGETADFIVATLEAEDTAALKRERIKLVQVPASNSPSFVIRVLGKRRLPSFENDLEEPAIRGVENCLMAFAHADMLERDEQYGKAAAKMQEAVALLAQLQKLETVQQAHNMSITPDGGYGDDYDLRAGASGWSKW